MTIEQYRAYAGFGACSEERRQAPLRWRIVEGGRVLVPCLYSQEQAEALVERLGGEA